MNDQRNHGLRICDRIQVMIIVLVAVMPVTLIHDNKVYAQSDTVGTTITERSWTVIVDGKQYPIRFTAHGNFAIHNMTIDDSAKALIVTLKDGHDNGTLEIELPKIIINSLDENQESIGYEVLVDGSSASFVEEGESMNHRYLRISFERDAKEIMIIGTEVIPEFPLELGLASVAGTAAAIAGTRIYRGN